MNSVFGEFLMAVGNPLGVNDDVTSGNVSQVYSTVVLKDRNDPIQVNYQMRRDGNEWKIYDISIDAIDISQQTCIDQQHHR